MKAFMPIRKRLMPGQQLFGDVFDARESIESARTGFIEKLADGRIRVTILYPEAHFFERLGGLGGVQHPGSSFENTTRYFIFSGAGSSIALYGCRESGRSSSTFRHTASISFVAEHAVHLLPEILLGGGCGAMRAEISGLFSWIGQGAVERESSCKNGSSPESISVKTINNPPFEIDKTSKFRRTLRSTWAVHESGYPSHRGPAVTVQSRGLFQLDYFAPGPWRPSLRDIEAIRDLISISSWSPQEVLEIDVCFSILEPEEQDEEPDWKPMDGIDTIQSVPEQKPPTIHLFPFSEIGREGICKWLEIYNDPRSARTIQSLNLLLREDLVLPQRINLIGNAIDGIFHYLFPQEETKDDFVGFKTECDRIRKEVRCIFNKNQFPNWSARMADAYNRTKHAGKTVTSDSHDEIRTYIEALFIVRVLLAKILGVEMRTLKELIQIDYGNPRRFTYGVTHDPFDDW
ncbi:hypothetical protein [Corynebacterium sp. NML 120412]|uniref:ApeA N-terminal domain 1-containing protein n=1 Tax=Corynebacterium sp. NML 120412 TaxID=2029401 RepID=UPI0013043E1B|nr:hypothetical protein [Corynebacterium sp. NML 120412]